MQKLKTQVSSARSAQALRQHAWRIFDVRWVPDAWGLKGEIKASLAASDYKGRSIFYIEREHRGIRMLTQSLHSLNGQQWSRLSVCRQHW